ncbi:MAG: cyclopropane-fatty-acyl-phospholipid synthase [Flavobacteriales bacterium]|jgi:cyclopropane-fatty-acyl-phospholipid synthase
MDQADKNTVISVSRKSETQKHYDQEVPMFQSFLDPLMKYSSGLYIRETDDESIAAINMLKELCSYIPEGNARVLEVGLGWGSLPNYISNVAQRKNVTYTAINPSPVQNAWLRKNIDSKLDIIEETFENIDTCPFEGEFDCIYFVGSFAHMQDKANCMKRLALMLKSNGKIIIEDTFYLSDNIKTLHGQRPKASYVQTEVFGVSPISSLPEFINYCAAAGLGLYQLLEHSHSYRLTINTWIEKLKGMKTQYPAAQENIDYLRIAQAGWEYTTANHLLVIKKNRRRPYICP